VVIKLTRSIKIVSEKIINTSFIVSHKASTKDFTRKRTLSFQIIFMQILRKTVKSLQVSLNELFMSNHIASVVTSSAYTQARKKFKHTAFIELNDDIVNIFYSDDSGIKKWRNYRCLGADASKVILPLTPDIEVEYGSIAIKNQSMTGRFSQGMFECYYDVLNHMAVKCALAHGLSYEVNLAIEMLDVATRHDLLIYDRGYASYEFLATLTQQQKNFLIRCPVNSFKDAQKLAKDPSKWSCMATLTPCNNQQKNTKEKKLPFEIQVRFIKVILSTGEIEILATSLIDPTITCEEFKWLYGMRWSVETYFSRVKGRLCLENFTGKTVESIKQDFWSTIFISNFETMATGNIHDELNKNKINMQHEKKVNTAVSFNAIKNMAFDIFNNNTNQDESVQKMILLFKSNPILQRPERESPPRQKTSDHRSYNFLRRVKKMIF